MVPRSFGALLFEAKGLGWHRAKPVRMVHGEGRRETGTEYAGNRCIAHRRGKSAKIGQVVIESPLLAASSTLPSRQKWNTECLRYLGKHTTYLRSFIVRSGSCNRRAMVLHHSMTQRTLYRMCTVQLSTAPTARTSPALWMGSRIHQYKSLGGPHRRPRWRIRPHHQRWNSCFCPTPNIMPSRRTLKRANIIRATPSIRT